LARPQPAESAVFDNDGSRRRDEVKKEASMRLALCLLASLFAIQAALACPAGYYVCGNDRSLCCR
jgi:hypothetical protein